MGKHKGDEQAQPRTSINLRMPPALMARVQAVSEALGIDPTSLVRMVITENLWIYEQRAEEVRKRRPTA